VVSSEDLSPPRRSVEQNVRNALIVKIAQTAAKENIRPSDLEWMIKDVRCVIDQRARTVDVLVRWWSGRESKFRINEGYILYNVEISACVMLQKDQHDPTAVLRGQLSARTELHHFRLNQHFPKHIREVQLERNMEKNQLMICVTFVNGHKVSRPEAEATSKDFLALCGMLYDLPPKE
jgi:hypothetical protein